MIFVHRSPFNRSKMQAVAKKSFETPKHTFAHRPTDTLHKISMHAATKGRGERESLHQIFVRWGGGGGLRWPNVVLPSPPLLLLLLLLRGIPLSSLRRSPCYQFSINLMYSAYIYIHTHRPYPILARGRPFTHPPLLSSPPPSLNLSTHAHTHTCTHTHTHTHAHTYNLRLIHDAWLHAIKLNSCKCS